MQSTRVCKDLKVFFLFFAGQIMTIFEPELEILRQLSSHHFLVKKLFCDWSFCPRTFVNGRNKTFKKYMYGWHNTHHSTDITTYRLNRPRDWSSAILHTWLSLCLLIPGIYWMFGGFKRFSLLAVWSPGLMSNPSGKEESPPLGDIRLNLAIYSTLRMELR